MVPKDEYLLANRRRSALRLIRHYSVDELTVLAEIGDYVHSRFEMGASLSEALGKLKCSSSYATFLRDIAKDLTPYQAETAYLLQRGAINGIKPRINSTKRADEIIKQSLENMVQREQQMFQDVEEEFPLTSQHTRDYKWAAVGQ